MLHLYLFSNHFSGFFSVFLDIIVIISFLSAIFTIIAKNPIVSVLYLILLFSSISFYLIFIGINFIGISYLLVYVGAVSILFLFILMLINIRVSELINDTNNYIPLAILTLLAFFVPLSSLLPNNKGLELNTLVSGAEQLLYVSSNTWDTSLVNISDITSIGNIMYTNYSM
jgi:NADH-ubiquinone oxidoreductase chain 6